jgi:hypothetical protein
MNTRTDLNGAQVPASEIASVYPGPYKGAGSGRRSGVKAKTLKKMLKKAGLKVSGKKATLRARAKRARLLGGGVQLGLEHIANAEQAAPVGGRRRSSRRKY